LNSGLDTSPLSITLWAFRRIIKVPIETNYAPSFEKLYPISNPATIANSKVMEEEYLKDTFPQHTAPTHNPM
jgi:hypothetical protein